MKFIDPKTDFAFKRIFGNDNAKPILISFLNAVLGLEAGYKIADVILLNPYQAPKLRLSKNTFVDVKCKDERGIWYIVEMQVQYVKGFEKRIIYNASKAYANQIETGDNYTELTQVLSINLLDFVLFDDIERYLSIHTLKEELNNKNYIDEIRYYFIELPKFDKSENEIETNLEKWIFFIKNARNLEVVPNKLNEGEYRDAFEIANIGSMTKEEWEYYDVMAMKVQDEKGAIEAALEKGEQKGREEGEKKGRKEGEQKGRKEGEKKGRKEGREEGEKKGRKEGEQKGRKEGEQKGRKEGRKEGMVSLVLRLLNIRFNPVDIDNEVTGYVNSLGIEKLEELSEIFLNISSVEELRSWLKQNAD